ncbi:MAG: glycosyltransferase family 2 protein [Thermoplasmata archaeon]|nr:glycosyltransferase family 2 protein [Thermoplasmata archaeon]
MTLNWNRKHDTEECVNALLEMNYPNFEIVVVDNGSEDGSVDHLKEKLGDKIHIVANGKNLGYADGFNSGINYVMEREANYILILNNDTKIDKNALTELVKTAESDPKIGFVSGKVYHFNKPNVIQTVGKLTDPITLVGAHVGANEMDEGQYDEIRDYDFIDDVFLLVRWEVIEKVGGYDSNFFLYFEETDWCARVRRAGYRIVFAPAAKIWHKGSMSSGGGTNPVNTFWLARNRYPFIGRNGSPKQWNHFLLKNFFYQIPMTVFVRAVKGKFNILVSYIKGNLSGLIWVLRNKEQKEAIYEIN